MARTIKVEFVTDTAKAERDAQKLGRSFKSALDPAAGSASALRSSLTGLTSALGALASVAALRQISQFAIDLDKSRNAMTALTGSVDAANKKLAQLRELAKASPGVTQSFAVELFNQLKAVGTIGDQAIDKVIKSLGRLNTVFGNVGADFARNLQQIFDQGFEVSDIKEARGRVPIFDQLLKQAFGTNDPDKLRKLKNAGKLTLEAFMTGFAQAIDTDPRFKNVQESLGGKLQKSLDETKLKFAELGERLLRDFLPILDKLLPAVNTLLDLFSKLPTEIQAAAFGFAALAPALSPAINTVRTLTTAFLGLGRAMQASLGVVGLALIGGGVAFEGFQDMMARNQADIDRQMGPRRNIDGSLVNSIPATSNVPLIFADPAAEALKKPLKIGGGALGVLDEATGVFKRGGAGGGGAGNATASALKSNERAQKIAREVAELQKKIADSQAERGMRLIEEMQELSAEVDATRREIFDEPARREARRAQVAGFSAATAERLSKIDSETHRLEENTRNAALEKQRELLKSMPPILSDSERFMRGFAESVITTGDAFERLGSNIANSFRDVGNLLGNLKQSLLSFFNDLLGSSLQRVFGQIFAPIAGALGGGGGFAMPGGGGLFRTPGTFPGSISSSAIQSLFSSGSGAPPSTTALQELGSLFGIGGGSSGPATRPPTVAGAATTAARSGFSLSGLGSSLAAAAPFLGASLGAGLGGQSTFGNILGAVGGGAVGLGLSFGASVFSAAGGGLGALGPAALAALGPIALIGAPLLVGAIFAGKAAQRRKDEEEAGQFEIQARTAIEQLKDAVASGQVNGDQARATFENQILAQFTQQINTLKTESVRKSRLTNQVANLRRMYEALIPPTIAEQQKRQADAARFSAIDSRLIPQFAGGGVVGGVDRGFDSVRALVRPGEMILNQRQQASIRAMAGSSIFDRAGVPGVNLSGRFDGGGIAPSRSGGGGAETIVIDRLVLAIDAEGIAIAGMSGPNGEQVIINAIERVNLRKGRR